MSSTAPRALLPQHQALIDGSAVSLEVAAERGYRSVTTRAELRRLGFADSQIRIPALLIPVWSAADEIVTYQARPDEPRSLQGKALKYETPKGSRMALDVPRRARQWLRDPKRPLFITEGARKADAGVSAGLCAIALLGVWNWRGTNEYGGKTALPDWESVDLNGRTVYVVFDSDVMTKRQVHAALCRLVNFLRSRKARVFVIYLPPGEGGAKVGLDDYLAAGNSTEDLLALATPELLAPEDDNSSVYVETPTGLVWNKPTNDGHVPVLLTNFTARITAQVIEDDGVELHRQLEITARLGEVERRFIMPSTSFAGMNWVVEQVGAGAIVEPGFSVKDRARAAIQHLSGDMQERTVYVHVGWTRLADGRWCYLHSTGAIGPGGPVPGVITSLPGPLRLYVLPNPPSDDWLTACWRAVRQLLDLAPARIMFTIPAAVVRSVMGETDFTVHLVGPSGTFKTELAALAQSFWGPGLDSRHLPGSWSSTGNSLEALAFAAKDALLVIDDFAPTGSSNDVQRYHREADRILRAQGNRSGRGRLRPDGTLIPARHPRGVILSTGEDTPSGHSLRARLLPIEVSIGDVDCVVLTACQAAAASGAYAGFLAAFLQWIAPQFESLREHLRKRAVELRAEGTGDQHARIPAIIGELQAGFELMLSFVTARQLVSTQEAECLRHACWDALRQTARCQADTLQSAEPTDVFLRLLGAALAAGEAHLADRSGISPPAHVAVAVGWHDNQAQGLRAGWIDGEDVYLEPDVAHKAAQRMGSDVDRITVSVRTLVKRMSERGLLVSEDPRGKHVVRKVLQGKRLQVLHLRASLLGLQAQWAQEAQAPADQRAEEDHGPEVWAQNGATDAVSGPHAGPIPADGAVSRQGIGPDGPEGPEASSTFADRERALAHGLRVPADLLDNSVAMQGEVSQHNARPCAACGGTSLWRLLPGKGRPKGGDLTCARCHPPSSAPDEIEWREAPVSQARGNATHE